jgi:DNA-directed RNA polymerase subunit RPC12/RpoP
MEILKHGSHYKTIICPTCKAEFGYVDKDIGVYEDSSPIFGMDNFYTRIFVQCPECDRKITIKEVCNGEVVGKE